MKLEDLVEFNKKLMSQVWAIVNPSQMQVNQRDAPLEFDLKNSTKNYLLVPLKSASNMQNSSLSYRIDLESIKGFTESESSKNTLTSLLKSGPYQSLEELQKNAVFYSRLDHQYCF